MKRGGGKGKGSAFEREVCKQLSLFVTGGRTDDVFWRSAMSGGRATVSAKKGKIMPHVSGDLCATHPDGYSFISVYYVECKFYRDLKYTQMVTCNEGLTVKFWREAVQQAKLHHKEPLLVLKQNQQPILVACATNGLDICDLVPLASFPRLGFNLYLFEEAFNVEVVKPTKAPATRKLVLRKRPALHLKSKR